MGVYKLDSKFSPTGDQPQAIEQLVNGVNNNEFAQVLLGVTGSGKTFTMANVIAQLNKPVLILTHNKTLTAQLYAEFTEFFPDNAVEYFVSYYDYYQPEAYMSVSDTYIEKDLSINDEVDKLRLRASSSLMSGRRDVIIVASVSCIYGMGNPEDLKAGIIRVKKGEVISRNSFLYKLTESLYSRSEIDFSRGTFRVRGDTVDINLSYTDYGYRVTFFGDEIESIQRIELESGKKIEAMDFAAIFPANLYLAPKDKLKEIIKVIEDELHEHESFFNSEGRFLEAKRIKERVTFDIEMMRELGYCNGIENYSRFFDGRRPGTRPFCLLDFFPDDYVMMIDESHVTIPQVRGMWGGDRARKLNLVNYGFRLPSALDNRPLGFNEFEDLINQVIYVSATPGDYELEKTEGLVVEQIVRPTGLLDPPIEVRPSINQIDDLLDEIHKRIEDDERVLVTTLTKRMSEELTKYLARLNIKVRYIHSEVDTGRAARNSNGVVIFYADKVTKSMQHTIDETNRRRTIQIAYNEEHGITPQTIFKSKEDIMNQKSILDIRGKKSTAYVEADEPSIAADPIINYMSRDQLERLVSETESKMKAAAKDLDFITAAQHRDELLALKKKLKAK